MIESLYFGGVLVTWILATIIIARRTAELDPEDSEEDDLLKFLMLFFVVLFSFLWFVTIPFCILMLLSHNIFEFFVRRANAKNTKREDSLHSDL